MTSNPVNIDKITTVYKITTVILNVIDKAEEIGGMRTRYKSINEYDPCLLYNNL